MYNNTCTSMTVDMCKIDACSSKSGHRLYENFVTHVNVSDTMHMYRMVTCEIYE